MRNSVRPTLTLALCWALFLGFQTTVGPLAQDMNTAPSTGTMKPKAPRRMKFLVGAPSVEQSASAGGGTEALQALPQSSTPEAVPEAVPTPPPPPPLEESASPNESEWESPDEWNATEESEESETDRDAPELQDDSPALVALRRDLDALFDMPTLGNAMWGVAIRSLDTGKNLYMRNASKGFMPASNLKMYTTAAGLALLGPDFKYETRLYSTDANLQDGVVNGDLYVVGSGDPTFAARFHGGNSLKPFEDWAQALAQAGVKRVEGNVIGDDDVFDDAVLGDGWACSYLDSWYAAEVNGLSLNDNCYDVGVAPGPRVGEPLSIKVRPSPAYGEFVVQALTRPAGKMESVSFHREIGANTVVIKGVYPMGRRGYEHSITVHNPTLFFCANLKHVLERTGIAVGGKALDIDDLSKSQYQTSAMKLVATYQSPPLSDIVRWINKKSQNLYAEQLFKTLGAHRGGGGSFKGGYQAVRSFLSASGVDVRGLVMHDGSGLSRLDQVEPQQTVGLLEAMYRHKHFQSFYDSLPIAGVDGTLANRLGSGPTYRNVHAKTGFIQRVLSLSGYVKTRDGETLAFCMMINNFTTPSYRPALVQNNVCERLARLEGRKSVLAAANRTRP